MILGDSLQVMSSLARREDLAGQEQTEHLGHREHQLFALDERRREFPEPLAEVAFLEADREPHLLEDVEVPLDLPFAALHPRSQFLRADAEAMGLEGLQEVPLTDERVAACHSRPSFHNTVCQWPATEPDRP